MYIRSASSPSTVLWAFHTIQPSSTPLLYFDDAPIDARESSDAKFEIIRNDIRRCISETNKKQIAVPTELRSEKLLLVLPQIGYHHTTELNIMNNCLTNLFKLQRGIYNLRKGSMPTHLPLSKFKCYPHPATERNF